MDTLITELLKHRSDKHVLENVLKDSDNYKNPRYTFITNIQIDKETYTKLFNILNKVKG